MESTLTPDDAVDVLEELLPAQNKAYELGLKLKLPQERVEGIQRLYSEPRQQLLHILVEFTNQEEPRPTRKTIVEALKSPAIDLPALARKIEASHVRKNSATGEPPLSPLSDQSGVADSVFETSAEVQRESEELKFSFKEYKHHVKECLKKQRVTPKRTVDILTSADVDEYQSSFLLSNLEELFKASDHDQLFVVMNFNLDYLDPSLIDNLVVEFKLGEEVKVQMAEYSLSLHHFRKRTPLTLFCRTRKRKNVSVHHSTRECIVEFDWAEVITLECVERFRQSNAPNLSPCECAVVVADALGLVKGGNRDCSFPSPRKPAVRS